jgi:hypothetical protein
MFSTQMTHRLRAVALFVLLAALLAPAARAANDNVRPDDRAGSRGTQVAGDSAVVVPDAVERYLMSHTPRVIASDDRPGIRGDFPSSPAGSLAQTQVVSDTFHWGDAGIGAVSALAFLLAAGGALTYMARRSRASLAGF